MAMSVVRVERTGPTRPVSRRLPDAGEAGDAALDLLLEADVGGGQAGLGPGDGIEVVDLDDQGGPVSWPGRAGQAGERATIGRRGGGVVVVVAARTVERRGRGASSAAVPARGLLLAAARAGGEQHAPANGERSGPGRRDTGTAQSSLSASMRSSRGGWVSNSRLSQPAGPWRRGGRVAEPQVGGRRASGPRRVPVPCIFSRARPGRAGSGSGPTPERSASASRWWPDGQLEAEAGQRARTGAAASRASGPAPPAAAARAGAPRIPNEGHRHRRGEDVVALDVAQLVGEHGLELDAVEPVEQAGGDDQGGVAGGAAHGEGVQAGVVDHVQAGLRARRR